MSNDRSAGVLHHNKTPDRPPAGDLAVNEDGELGLYKREPAARDDLPVHSDRTARCQRHIYITKGTNLYLAKKRVTLVIIQ